MTSEVILSRYKTIRKATEDICEPLKPEDFVIQPTVEVSPPKWHLAHTTWFFEEFLLSKYLNGYKRFHPRYAFLFNSYYEAVGTRMPRLDRGNISRPGVDEIMAYRKYVDDSMINLIPDLKGKAMDLLQLGLHHEQQHQELLYVDIKFILGHNPLFPPYDRSFVETPDTFLNTDFATLPEGYYEIGFQGEGFSFDNEREIHRIFLSSVEICKGMVTNEEYLNFIEDGGYRKSMYWHSDAWAWLHEHHIDSPLYWHKIDGVWHRYALSGMAPLDMSEPVTHLTYYEAAAYAEWAGMRLPTEFEWEAASDRFTWGCRWEYTNSAYLPYPGFVRENSAVGEYNGKFMVNQMVLRGSSMVTSPDHQRKTYRNFFYPYLGWQFTGMRLCKK